MKLDNNDGAICADPPDEKDDSNVSEIDLYSELIGFSKLPPEEQRQSIAALEQAVAAKKKLEEEKPAENAAVSLVNSSDAESSAASAELAPIQTRSESRSELPGQSVSIPAVPESRSDNEASPKSGDTPEIIPAAGTPRPSGPLSGFNLPPDIVYTGTIAAGACISCGAETGADDLFCVACGGFVDDIDTQTSIPKCPECKKQISNEELFCPWCGAASAG